MFVATNVTEHFRVMVTDLNQDLIISVTPLYGDPDVYVTSRFTDPYCYLDTHPNPYLPSSHCFNYTWFVASDGRSDVLKVRSC